MKDVNHIGIIMDGNRRFAKRLMMKPWKGHEWGAKKLEQLAEWCKEYDIHELTLYTFSIQNFNRPKEEFEYLMKIFKKSFQNALEQEHKIHQNRIKIRFIGRLELFPEEIQRLAKEMEEKTKDYSDYQINFAFGYGGREELIDATKRIVELANKGLVKTDDVSEELIKENLYMPDEPDFIIRTGGDRRTSNFLLYQSSYSEWFFLEKNWPEFEKEDFVKCIEEFKSRERRFGK